MLKGELVRESVPGAERQSVADENTTKSGRTAAWDTGRRRSLRVKWAAQKAVEKWKTLRVSHFPTAPTTAFSRSPSYVKCSNVVS